jgi:CHAD domain-containing protein
MPSTIAPSFDRQLEREMKFAVKPDFELPDLRAMVSRSVREPEATIDTAYFDTPDLRLWERGLTLRHRVEQGGEQTWTLKLPQPSSGPTLERDELSWPGSRQDVPAPALAILKGILRRDHVEQVVEMDTKRLRWSLADRSGTAWAEVDLDDVTVVGGPRDGLRFKQLELEIAEEANQKKSRDAVVAAFRRAGAAPANVPKLALALGLTDHGRRRHSTGRRSNAVDLARHAVAEGLDRLLDHDYRLRYAPDPEGRAVHQARVATRRLRSDLQTLAPLVHPIWLRHTTTELRWIGNTLGEVRDCQVLDRRLADEDGATEATAALRGRLREQQTAATDRLKAAIDSTRYIDLLDRLHAAAATPPMSAGTDRARHMKARKVLPSMVNKRWHKLHKRVTDAGATPSDRSLHRIRIAAKNLRYASELSEPILGQKAAQTGKKAKSAQTVLGDHHDASSAIEWLTENADATTHRAAFAAGTLAEREQTRKEELARSWKREWSKLARPAHRRWIKK